MENIWLDYVIIKHELGFNLFVRKIDVRSILMLLIFDIVLHNFLANVYAKSVVYNHRTTKMTSLQELPYNCNFINIGRTLSDQFILV